MQEGGIQHIARLTGSGWEIRDAIILKSYGHESEPVLTIHRQGATEFANFVIMKNPLYSYDPLMKAMNILRKYIARNIQQYQKFVAEFAGMEKEWSSEVQLSNLNQYGVTISDVLIFPRFEYDARSPLQLQSVDRFNIENSIVLNKERIQQMPKACQEAIQFIRQKEHELLSR